MNSTKNSIYFSVFGILLLFFLSVTLTSEQPKIHLIPYHEADFLETDGQWADSVLKSLSVEDKIAQLLIADFSSAYKLTKLSEKVQFGGVRFSNTDDLAQLEKIAPHVSIFPFSIISQESVTFTKERYSLPGQSAIGHISDDAQLFDIGKLVGSKLKSAGANFFIGGYANLDDNSPYSYGTNKYQVSRLCMQLHEGLGASGIISASGLFPYSHVLKVSKKQLDTTYLVPFRRLIANGLNGMVISPHIFMKENLQAADSALSFHSAENILRRRLDFEGLVLSYMPDSSRDVVAQQALESILHGANIVLNLKDIAFTHAYLVKAYHSGKLGKRMLNARCKKNLLAKGWLRSQDDAFTSAPSEIEEEIVLKKMAKESFTVLKNDGNYLPIADLPFRSFAHIHYGTLSVEPFNEMLSQYVEFEHFDCKGWISTDSLARSIARLSAYKNIIVSVDSSWKAVSLLSSALSILGTQCNVALVALGPSALNHGIDTKNVRSVAMATDAQVYGQQTAAQIMFGALPAKGILPNSFLGYKPYFGIRFPAIDRLEYTFPEEVGMSSKILLRIDSIANEAISQKATPGCQILVARNGAVVYEKSFGHFTFDNKRAVSNRSLYDLASITKVAASTVSLMRLTDESRFEISEPLQTYLPYLDSTDKGDLLLTDVLTHQARLHPWIPFYLTLIDGYDDPDVNVVSSKKSAKFSVQAGNNFYLRTGYRFRDSLISDSASDLFSIEVAKGIYLNKWYVDSMFCRIDRSKLRDKKEYKYSDLGYYYIKEIIERIAETGLQQYADSVFYEPLGAHRMGYLPLHRYSFDDIVPTEDDPIFRKQLLQGYVHDPGAAMLGGVGGHAGLFSNANDLAKLLQMLLNKGEYGGKMYLHNTTIDKYTACPNCAEGNRRGYGFDKPNPDPEAISPVCENVSLRSFGHTGFTGTIMWADPDEDLIYIFLSNRICPTSDNKKIYKLDVRPSIQRAIYAAITDSDQK